MKFHRSQSGAVLVVSLIMLLLMTIIGFAAMNTSVLEVLMSANTVRQTVTLSSAENSLRIGEVKTEELVMSNATEGKAFYYNHYDAVTEPLDTGARSWKGISYNTVSGQGAYVIEYIGPRDIPGCTAAWNEYSTGCKVHAHLVSARSGGDPESEENAGREALRIVQSVFITLQSP